MHPCPEILELAQRLLYRPDLLARHPEAGLMRKGRSEGIRDWLERLRREAGEDQIPAPAQLEAQTQLCRRQGIRAVCLGEAAYPPSLRDLVFPPPVLFFKGELPVAEQVGVAIVGSRRASRGGREFAAALGRGAAAAGLSVHSGLARGIDQAAHRGCLEQGPTWAVLGNGLDSLYPPEATGLAETIVNNGGLLSEFPPGCPPLPFHFPRRNRIIAALSRALVVVEAGARSGALHTAAEALALGRGLGAAPGSPGNPSAAGSNRLLKEGAELILEPDDMMALFGVTACSTGDPEPWSPERCEREGVRDLETLAARSGWLFTEVIEAVALWEREGKVLRLEGGAFSFPADKHSPAAAATLADDGDPAASDDIASARARE